MTTTYKWQAGLLCALAIPALVALPQQSFAQEEELIEEIITTGTRRADRSAADSPVAIDVIGASEFAQNSSADVQDMLRTSVPSFDVNTQPISDAAKQMLTIAKLRRIPVVDVHKIFSYEAKPHQYYLNQVVLRKSGYEVVVDRLARIIKAFDRHIFGIEDEEQATENRTEGDKP